ncbi:MAG: ATP-binding protein [Lachnospiraceae bacterium]|nr:ATP-binding protein [Lachnospiraceae bacterium]
MKKNPFTLSFGKEPAQFISRLAQTNEMVENFTDESPVNQICMLTGVRGSGKTVMLTSLSKEFKKHDDWVVVELNPMKDMLLSLAAKLYSIKELGSIFIKAKLNLTVFGIGVSIDNSLPISDIETALEKMLDELRKHNKKLLILVDEIVNNEYVRIFSSTFQIFLRQNYSIFLIMTGLYGNIYDLQNESSLTFLYRAPKVMLEPLNINAIAKMYNQTLGISFEKSMKMAGLTKGYPFAFQVLGYLCWNSENKDDLNEILPKFDQYLEEYVYEKIWSELSETDRRVVGELSQKGEVKIKEIRDELNMNSGEMSVYKSRLLRKGIISSTKYGYISLSLPRFAEIVQNWMMGEE